jgi:hypothetical protein
MTDMEYTEEAWVVRKTWGLGDTYLVIDLHGKQVFEEDGWRDGDKVTVTVTVKRWQR